MFGTSRKGETEPANGEQTLQAAVLRLLLIEHPAQLTLEEIRRELLAGRADEIEEMAIDAAVRALAGAGLVNLRLDLVLPSRAAVCFDRLPVD